MIIPFPLAHSKYKIILKLHDWFKSYDNVKQWIIYGQILPSGGVPSVGYQRGYPVCFTFYALAEARLDIKTR